MIYDIDNTKLKAMSIAELEKLCEEIRGKILDTVRQNGGHLASNLGVIELTVALNHVFDNDNDYISFDVGHQCYAHKILNGRANDFDSLRQHGGVSGFPNFEENARDSTSAGHSSTALSLALGQAAALKLLRDKREAEILAGDKEYFKQNSKSLKDNIRNNNDNTGNFTTSNSMENPEEYSDNNKEISSEAAGKTSKSCNEEESKISRRQRKKHIEAAKKAADANRKNVIAIVGDGAFTGGEAFEALNNINQIDYPLTVILNDNEMSISRNVGAISRQLSRMRISNRYIAFKRRVEGFFSHIPLLGRPILWLAKKIQNFLKTIFTRGTVFEHFGLKYVGMIDGHNLKALVKILKKVKKAQQKVLLHVITKKGYGFADAENMPQKYHGVAVGMGISKNEISAFAAGQVLSLAEKDDRVCVISAAMTDGTGFSEFAEKFPNRVFDVGIAEQHAVTFACGLANIGFKPYVAVYSTFFQRAIDQIMVDVCINKLPVTLLVDRCGLSGFDGKTHHGIFDVSYLSMIPNITILCPKDKGELSAAIAYSYKASSPIAIRYNNTYFGEFDFCNSFDKTVDGMGDIYTNVDNSIDKMSTIADSNVDNCAPSLDITKWERLVAGGFERVIISYSHAMLSLCMAAAEQLRANGKNVTVINARCIKPIDKQIVLGFGGAKILVVEDHVKTGSLGSQIAELLLLSNIDCEFFHLCFGDQFVGHGSNKDLLAEHGFTAENIMSYFEN